MLAGFPDRFARKPAGPSTAAPHRVLLVATPPEPEEIYRRTQEEERRRPARPPLELAADVSTSDLFHQLGSSVTSNLIGGVILVTLARTVQAAGSSRSSE
jgi:hypothetical protein